MRTSHLRRAAAGGALAVVAATGLTVLAAGPAFAASSKVSVVHGIPGQPVDVYVNRKLTLKNLQPKDVAGPLSLKKGKYDIALTKPGENIDKALLTVNDAAVPGNGNISLVAHLSKEAKPVLTPFANDTSKLKAGQARLIVRHTAAAPAVDVRAGGKPVFEDLTNPKEAKADLDAGTVSADVVLAGTKTVVLGPTDLNLKEGTATIVYATGSAEADSLEFVAQTIEGLHSSPSRVHSGTGGAADTGLATPWYAVGALGVLFVAFGVRRMAR